VQAENIRQVLKRVWGYDALLPLQAEAIGAVLARRDSIVILRTGGGKSLCCQAPAAAMGRLAAFLNSSLTAEERRVVEAGVLRGRYHLLYVAPERLVLPSCLGLLRRAGPGAMAWPRNVCCSTPAATSACGGPS